MKKKYATNTERITHNVAIDDNGCWLWQRALTSKGYGRVNTPSGIRSAHRYSYEVFVGPIPPGLTLDHTCRNRACVNPGHLEPISQRENSLRSPLTINAINAAKTHCPQGHPYDEANTYVIPSNGGRMCRACIAARAALARAA